MLPVWPDPRGGIKAVGITPILPKNIISWWQDGEQGGRADTIRMTRAQGRGLGMPQCSLESGHFGSGLCAYQPCPFSGVDRSIPTRITGQNCTSLQLKDVSALLRWQHWGDAFLTTVNPFCARRIHPETLDDAHTSSRPSTLIACVPLSISQTTSHQPNRIWEQESAPLFSIQSETFSGTDDWARERGLDSSTGKKKNCTVMGLLWHVPKSFPKETGTMEDQELNRTCWGVIQPKDSLPGLVWAASQRWLYPFLPNGRGILFFLWWLKAFWKTLKIKVCPLNCKFWTVFGLLGL